MSPEEEIPLIREEITLIRKGTRQLQSLSRGLARKVSENRSLVDPAASAGVSTRPSMCQEMTPKEKRQVRAIGKHYQATADILAAKLKFSGADPLRNLLSSEDARVAWDKVGDIKIPADLADAILAVLESLPRDRPGPLDDPAIAEALDHAKHLVWHERLTNRKAAERAAAEFDVNDRSLRVALSSRRKPARRTSKADAKVDAEIANFAGYKLAAMWRDCKEALAAGKAQLTSWEEICLKWRFPP